jgi:hypothetical protein
MVHGGELAIEAFYPTTGIDDFKRETGVSNTVRRGPMDDSLSDLSTSSNRSILPSGLFLDSIQLSECCLRSAMLDCEFKKQRAQVLRDLVATTNDPFIKKRLLALMSRYQDRVSAHTPLTPLDLKFQSQSTGSKQ